MTANEVFKVGDRVRMTKLAVEHKLEGGVFKMGEVVGFSRDFKYVRVLIEGKKVCGNYSTAYWEITK